MDTDLTASVATFRVFSSSQRQAANGKLASAGPPRREERMATTQVTEGPLILSRLVSNEITYLQVNSYTRAIMPRSKIWRVSSNELVIPGSFTNFWLITLSGAPNSVARLDRILKGLCRYEIASVDDEGLLEAPSTEDELTGLTEQEDSFELPESPRKSGLVASARETISQGKMSERLSGIHEFNNAGFSPDHKRTPLMQRKRYPDSPQSQQTLTAGEDEASAANKAVSDADHYAMAGSRNVPAAKDDAMLGATALATPPISPPSVPSSSDRDVEGSALLVPSSSPLRSETRIPSAELADILGDLQISSSAPENYYRQLGSDPTTAAAAIAPFGEEDASLVDDYLTPEKLEFDPSSAADMGKPAEQALENVRRDNSRAKTALTLGSTAEIEEASLKSAEPKAAEMTRDVVSAPFPHSTLATILKAQTSSSSKFEPRFSHPLIPSSQITWYRQVSSAGSISRTPRLSLQRRELTTIGPGSLHQDISTVGGYIGLKAVKGILKKS